MKNPERTLSIAVLLGVASFACRAYGVSLAVTVPVSLALCVGAFFFAFFSYGRIISKSIVAVSLAATFCIVGNVGGSFLLKSRQNAEALISDQPHKIVCTVEKVSYSESFSSRVVASVTEIDGEKTKMRVSINFPFDPELYQNDVFSADGTFVGPDKYEEFYESDGVYVSFNAENSEYISSQNPDIFDSISDLRNALSQKLFSLIKGKEGRVASAIALGDKSGIPQSVKLDFRRAGASHILAVSGMHLSVIILALRHLLSAVSKKKKNIVLICIALFYMTLTGFSPSVCRAALMMCIFLVADMIGENSDGITSLAISMTVILAVSPSTVYSVGFWLSCAATLGILVVVPSFKLSFLIEKDKDNLSLKVVKRVLRYVITLFIVSFSAQMFTIPILMTSFGGASVMSLVSGVLLVPISEIALILSLLTAVFAYVPLLSAAFAFLARIPLALLLFLTGKISDVDGAYISLGQPFTPYIIVAGAALTLTVIFVKKLDKRLILAIGTVCVAAFIVCNAILSSLNFKNTDVYYSVNKSNESFVIVSQGNTFVVDVSNGGYATFENAVNNVNFAYREEIDYIVLTHLHSNQINGLLKTASTIKVKNILLPTAENESDAMVIRSITHALEDKVNIIYYNRSHHSEIGIGNVTVTLPEYVTLKRSTHPVISFCIEENGHRIGYIGASALDAENANINNIYLNSDCLIVGAHGPVIKEELTLDCCVSENIVVGSGAEEQIRIEGYGGNVIYPSDSGGRVHIRFENK